MNWIQGIQAAIDYVEENIRDDIDFEKVAKRAYSSSFHFQRVFSILCGFSLGDYIRMRRLSLAGEELSKGNVKIFTPLSVKLILTGGSKMNYRIEKRDSFQIVCKRKKVEKPMSGSGSEEINEMWKECSQDGSLDKLVSYIPQNSAMNGLLGICFTSELVSDNFSYGIGVEYDGRKVDKNLEIVTIPKNTYAVFTAKGKMPDAFIETYKRIVTEFFPQSTQYEYASNVEFEVYYSDDILNPNYECEIWIAVNEK